MYLFTYEFCNLFISLDSIFISIYFFFKGILCKLAFDFWVFLELEIEPRELCFDRRDPFIESVLLLSCLLEYKLFWEFILSYIFLFSFVISFSLFLRMLKYVLRWLYLLWTRSCLLKPGNYWAFLTLFDLSLQKIRLSNPIS